MLPKFILLQQGAAHGASSVLKPSRVFPKVRVCRGLLTLFVRELLKLPPSRLIPETSEEVVVRFEERCG